MTVDLVSMKKIVSVSLCCLVSLSCTSEIKQDDGGAKLISVGLAQDGGTECLTILYKKSIVKCCIDRRIDSEYRGRLFTGEYPEYCGSRLVNKDDVEIIEAVLHLDPKDISLEQGKRGPYNTVEVFRKKVRELAESHR